MRCLSTQYHVPLTCCGRSTLPTCNTTVWALLRTQLFTKLLAPALAFLQTQGFHVTGYLDDRLLKDSSATISKNDLVLSNLWLNNQLFSLLFNHHTLWSTTAQARIVLPSHNYSLVKTAPLNLHLHEGSGLDGILLSRQFPIPSFMMDLFNTKNLMILNCPMLLSGQTKL